MAEAFSDSAVFCPSGGATSIRRYCWRGRNANAATLQATSAAPVPKSVQADPACPLESTENESKDTQSKINTAIILGLYPQRSATYPPRSAPGMLARPKTANI